MSALDQARASDTSSKLGSYQLGGDVLRVRRRGRLSGERRVRRARRSGDILGPGAAPIRSTSRGPGDPGELTMGGVASADGDLRTAGRARRRPQLRRRAGRRPSTCWATSRALRGYARARRLASTRDDTSISRGRRRPASTAGSRARRASSVAERRARWRCSTTWPSHGRRSRSPATPAFASPRPATRSSSRLAASRSAAGRARTPSGRRDPRPRRQPVARGDAAATSRSRSGQRMVVNGSLRRVRAKNSIALTDTAALRIKLVSHDLIVRSGC